MGDISIGYENSDSFFLMLEVAARKA